MILEEKTLYITDLDGTLLNSCKEVSEFTSDCINTLIAKGVNFSIASARSAVLTVRLLSGLNINVPVVLMNGVVIYDLCRSKYIKTEYIPVDAVNAVLSILNEFDITGFMYAVRNDNLITYYENLDSSANRDFYDERVKKYYKSFEQVDSFLNKTKSSSIIYFSLIDEYERLSMVLKDLKDQPDIDMVLYKDIYTENLWYLEIYSINASKYNAVRYIREYYNFDKIIGFGDNLNDIPLFKACDECYAVSNAVYELKEKATGIIADHNSDGVARFIVEREAYCKDVKKRS